MSSNASYADWIAVDWGTSRLRAWAMAADEPRAEAQSDEGMGRLAPDKFEPALLRLIEPWLGAAPIDVVACGMVGARQGWVEAPYSAVPCPPLGRPLGVSGTRDRRLRVRILPGLKQADPPDVMRGEETQIAGILAHRPRFDGIACLPGSHTKWAEISAGEVVSFRTFVTGELFAAIGRHTVLRHTIGPGWDPDAFTEAAADALSRPEALAQRLFGLRAEALLKDLPPAAAQSRLSGLLIGAELAAARPYWLGRDVVIVGESDLAARYETALTAQGLSPTIVPSRQATLAGLAVAHAALEAG